MVLLLAQSFSIKKGNHNLVSDDQIITMYVLKAGDQHCHKLCGSEISGNLKFLAVH